jgi:hypothetical protein
MKRIFSLLAVTALMVAMLVASVSPVFAKPQRYHTVCTDPERPGFELIVEAKINKIDKIEKAGLVCDEPVPI